MGDLLNHLKKFGFVVTNTHKKYTHKTLNHGFNLFHK